MSWPYPSFGSDVWLAGDPSDDALTAVRSITATTTSRRGQTPSPDPQALRAGLGVLADLAERVEWAMLALVGEARAQGMSWAEIGEALGVSRQAAHKRFAHWVEEALARAPERTQ